MLLKDLREGSVYSFTTYNAATLGANHTKMLLVGRVSFDIALPHDTGIANKHLAVYASLPPGVTRDATKLTYLLFRTAGNQMAVFAYDWLIAETLNMIQATKLTVEVMLTSSGQENEILRYLAEGGFQVRQSTLG